MDWIAENAASKAASEFEEQLEEILGFDIPEEDLDRIIREEAAGISEWVKNAADLYKDELKERLMEKLRGW